MQHQRYTSGKGRPGYNRAPTDVRNGKAARKSGNVAHRHISAEAEEGKNRKDYDDQAHQVDDAMHLSLPENWTNRKTGGRRKSSAFQVRCRYF